MSIEKIGEAELNNLGYAVSLINKEAEKACICLSFRSPTNYKKLVILGIKQIFFSTHETQLAWGLLEDFYKMQSAKITINLLENFAKQQLLLEKALQTIKYISDANNLTPSDDQLEKYFEDLLEARQRH